MNRDMEEKGIVFQELSCRTCRRDLPPPDLPASAAVQLPEYTRWSSRKASATVQLPEDCRRSFCGDRKALTAARRQSGGGRGAETDLLVW
ncbi:unnamed protein product [Boreogadus saida]